jgi:hypothetical protein
MLFTTTLTRKKELSPYRYKVEAVTMVKLGTEPVPAAYATKQAERFIVL